MGLFPECHPKEQSLSTTQKRYGAESEKSTETGDVKMQKCSHVNAKHFL
jgi:hypothetical protein